MAVGRMRVTAFKVNASWLTSQMSSGGDIDKAFIRAAGKTRDRARRNIQAKGRVDTGRMVQSVAAKKISPGVYEVRAPVPYSLYQEEGTSIHGPRRAKRLVFKVKGQKGLVFARRVRGIKGAHFMRDAVQSLSSADFT